METILITSSAWAVAIAVVGAFLVLKRKMETLEREIYDEIHARAGALEDEQTEIYRTIDTNREDDLRNQDDRFKNVWDEIHDLHQEDNGIIRHIDSRVDKALAQIEKLNINN
jgi:replicative DNA helicase